MKKLYFFHELTHALQTSYENGIEKCGFYNGHNGMFLTEGATQYTAEMLYNVSNDTRMNNRLQPGSVRGASDRTPNSPLSEYQYNGDILALLAESMDLPLPQVLAIAYKNNGRETLKNIYEGMDGNRGKFDELMNDLEKIYSIDKLLIYGYDLQNPTLITMQDQVSTFKGSLNIYRELMNKTESRLVESYMRNHPKEYVLQNYQNIAQYLTTPELKNYFLTEVQRLSQEINLNDVTTNLQGNQNFEINEFGEIIRPANTAVSKTIEEKNVRQNKLSLKQRVAQFLQKNNLFMNLSFVEKFVHNQLDILPPVPNEMTNIKQQSAREIFMNFISNNGELRNMPQPQRMLDLDKLEQMRKNSKENKINERD